MVMPISQVFTLPSILSPPHQTSILSLPVPPSLPTSLSPVCSLVSPPRAAPVESRNDFLFKFKI